MYVLADASCDPSDENPTSRILSSSICLNNGSDSKDLMSTTQSNPSASPHARRVESGENERPLTVSEGCLSVVRSCQGVDVHTETDASRLPDAIHFPSGE